MKPLLISVALLLTFCVFAEEKVTVFKMKDGRTIEAVRIAAVGDEGERTFTLKTTTGERVMVMEADVESRIEKKVARGELSENAAVPPPAKPPATQKQKEDNKEK